MMKKFISVLCAMAVAVSTAGCAAGNAASPSDASGTPPAEIQSGDETQSGGGEQPASDAPPPELAQGDPQGEITVSCFDSLSYKDFLELAAQSFETKYPGTKINIDAPSEMADVRTSEAEGEARIVAESTVDDEGIADYISKINTALMSGSGPDVMAMDVIPVYKFAGNGQLENMQPYIESDSSFNINDYRQNVLNAFMFQGGRYIFPLDYSFNYYTYDSTLLDEAAQSNFGGYKGFTISELAEISKASFESGSDIKMFNLVNDPMRTINMINELLEENGLVDVANKTANFNDGTFMSLLETAKGYEDSGYIDSTSASAGDLANFSGDTDARQMIKLKSNMSLLTAYMMRDGMDIAMPLDGVVVGVENDDKIAGIQKEANGDVKCTYAQGYGINSASTNKALAWEFIKFMAGAEMQESLQMFPMGLLGLPIHNEARAKKLEDGIRLSLFMPDEETFKNAGLTEIQKQDLAELTENTEKFSDMINTYHFNDTTVDSIVKSELEYFFDGSKTAEETAASIQSKVEMYFNE